MVAGSACCGPTPSSTPRSPRPGAALRPAAVAADAGWLPAAAPTRCFMRPCRCSRARPPWSWAARAGRSTRGSASGQRCPAGHHSRLVNLAHPRRPKRGWCSGRRRHPRARSPTCGRCASAWAVGLALGLTGIGPTHRRRPRGASVTAPRGRPANADRGRPGAPAVMALAARAWLRLGCGYQPGAAAAPGGRAHAAGGVRLAFLRKLAIALAAAGAAGIALGALASAESPGPRTWPAPRSRPLAGAARAGLAIGSPYAVVGPAGVPERPAFNDQTRFGVQGPSRAPRPSFGPYLALMADALTWPCWPRGPARPRRLHGERTARSGGDRARLLVRALPAVGVGPPAMRFLAPTPPAAAWLGALGLAALPARVTPARWR